jgi:methionyl-tRNA synthetase
MFDAKSGQVSTFYITTPIYYINDLPHIGSYYTTLVADVLARWNRLKGIKTFFLTGLDENSIKTVKAAKEKKYPNIQKYADEMAKQWLDTWKRLNVSFDGFVRTTDEKHKKNVINFFAKVYEKGDIYKGKYSGLYCEGCETFLTESELEKGLCPIHKKKPKEIIEENYFFKLSKYQKALLEHIEKNPDFIYPETRKNEVVSLLKQGLRDVSISRPDLEWGIEFPIDKKHKFWVWFDALINYLSQEDYWPGINLIGKDILRIHATIWPAMLLSAGYPLPKQIVAHGFLTVNGRKISKSLGNAIDPIKISEKYGLDSLRYFLLRETPFGEDGDFSEKALINRTNGELADQLGNLINRVLVLVEKNFNGEIPFHENNDLEGASVAILREMEEDIEKFKFNEALNHILFLVAEANKYIDEKKPWTLKDEDLADVLYNLLECIRFIALMLNPFMPGTSEKILRQLGIDKFSYKDFRWGLLKMGTKIKREEILFKKVEHG